MDPQEKEDIRLSSSQENESMLETDILYLSFGSLSAFELLTTLEMSNKNSIDNYLKEMSYSKKVALYCTLRKMDKNLDD